MTSFKKQLNLKFPKCPGEICLLRKACNRVGLSKKQKLHLLSHVLYTEEALTYWVTLYRKNASEGEQYLIRMAPPRDETSATLVESIKMGIARVLIPLARAIGLM